MKTNVHSLQYLAEFFLESETFHTRVSENTKTHFMSNNAFPEKKKCSLWDNVEIYSRPEQATW